jgi:hypothetical protein
MAVICYSKQRQFQRGVEYRNPTWFTAPLFRRGDRVVIVGNYPAIASAYRAAGVDVYVRSAPYLGDGGLDESPEPADTQPDTVLLPKVTHRQVEPEPPNLPLISMTKAELQAEASRLGVPYKAAASRSELLTLLGGK